MPRTAKRASAIALACGAIVTASAAHAAENDFIAGPNPTYLWGTSANWSAGIPNSASDVFFPEPQGFQPITVDLGGVNRFASSINFTNFDTTPTSTYTLANGSLSVNTITNQNYVGDSNVISADVHAAAGTLTVDTQDGTLQLDGKVTAQQLTYINSQGQFGGNLVLTNPNNAITSIDVSSPNYFGAHLVAAASGTLGNGLVRMQVNAALTITGSGPLTVYPNNLSVQYGSNIQVPDAPAGGTVGIVQMGQLSFELPDSYDFFQSDGGSTMAFTGTVINGTSSIDSYTFEQGRAHMDLGVVSEATPGSSINSYGPGTVTVSAPSSYTGNTIVSGGMLVAADAHAFSTGSATSDFYKVTASTNGTINYAVAQASFIPTFVGNYGGLVGDLTGAIYSGANANVLLSEGSILLTTAGPLPQRGIDVDHAAYLRAVDSISFNLTVGDGADHQSIFKGVAFGNYTPQAQQYSGSVSESVDGEGFEVYTTDGFWDLSQVAFNTSNTDTGVHFLGPGEGRIGANHGTATVFTITGATNFDNSNNYHFSLADHFTLHNGEVANISNGDLFTGYPDSLEPLATIHVLNTGTLVMGAYNTIPDGSLSSGIVNIDNGGAVYLPNTNATLAAGASFNFEPGSLLIFDNFYGTVDTGTPTWLPTNADIIVKNLASNTAFIGSGLVLGDQRRLTTPGDSSTIISGGNGIRAAAGATNVAFSAASGQYLQIGDDVNLAGVDLDIGQDVVLAASTLGKPPGTPAAQSVTSFEPFTTISNFTQRDTVYQDGLVELDGNVTTNNIDVYSGDLNVPGPSLNIHDFHQVGPGSSTLGAGTINLAGSLIQDDGFVYVNSPVNYGAGSSIIVNGGVLNLAASVSPALTDQRHQLTIGPSGVVYVDGPADPFSDGAGKKFNIRNDGSLNFYASSDVGTLDGAGFTDVIFGTTLTADYVRQGTLQLDGGGTVRIRSNGTNSGTSRLTNLVIANVGPGFPGGVDLTNNDLIIDYDPGSSPIATIRSYLANGFNAGNWNGSGINSSAAHADASFATALGYGVAGDIGIGTFDNQSVDPTTILIKFTYYGDANLDGLVTTADFQRLLDGLATGGTTWEQGDFTYDGKVDLGNDFTLFLINYLRSGGALGDLAPLVANDSALSGAQKAQLLSLVPEPTTAAILIAFAAPILARRRRHR